MILQSEIQDQLRALARGELSLYDFEDWIEDRGWNMHQDSAPGAVQLASDIYLLFSEHSAGLVDEEELRAGLLRLLDNLEVSFSLIDEPQVVFSFNSSAQSASVNLTVFA